MTSMLIRLDEIFIKPRQRDVLNIYLVGGSSNNSRLISVAYVDAKQTCGIGKASKIVSCTQGILENAVH